MKKYSYTVDSWEYVCVIKKYTYTGDSWEHVCRTRQNENARTVHVQLTSGQGRRTSYVCTGLARKCSTHHNISGVPFAPRPDTQNSKRHTLQRNEVPPLSALITSSLSTFEIRYHDKI